MISLVLHVSTNRVLDSSWPLLLLATGKQNVLRGDDVCSRPSLLEISPAQCLLPASVRVRDCLGDSIRANNNVFCVSDLVLVDMIDGSRSMETAQT